MKVKDEYLNKGCAFGKHYHHNENDWYRNQEGYLEMLSYLGKCKKKWDLNIRKELV